MDQHFATRKCHFLGSLGRRVQLGRAAALYCRVSTADQTLCPPGTRPTRLRQEGSLQNRGGLEGNRPRAKAGGDGHPASIPCFAFMGSTKSRRRVEVAGCGFTSWNLEAQYNPIGNAIADEIKKICSLLVAVLDLKYSGPNAPVFLAHLLVRGRFCLVPGRIHLFVWDRTRCKAALKHVEK